MKKNKSATKNNQTIKKIATIAFLLGCLYNLLAFLIVNSNFRPDLNRDSFYFGWIRIVPVLLTLLFNDVILLLKL